MFASDLSGLADPDTIQGWLQDLKRNQASAPVRTVAGVKAHTQGRGVLLLPWDAIEGDRAPVAGSWWAEAIVRYRGHALYAAATMLHSVASGVVSHDFGDDLAVVRTTTQRGLQAVALLLGDDLDDDGTTSAAVRGLLEQLQRERLDIAVLLTRKASPTEPLSRCVRRHLDDLGFVPSCDVVTTTVADWAGGRPQTTSVL